MEHPEPKRPEQPTEAAPRDGPGAHEEPDRDRPRIYVASLSDYNAGILHGTWLDADQEADQLWAGIHQMLAASPTTRRYGEVAEEWAIHDHEGFGPVGLGEWEPIERVARLARGIAAHGEPFAAWWTMDDRSDEDEADLEAQFEQSYLGEYDSLTAYGEHYLDEIGLDLDALAEIPEQLRPYVTIDAAGLARDLELEGAICTEPSPHGLYVFGVE